MGGRSREGTTMRERAGQDLTTAAPGSRRVATRRARLAASLARQRGLREGLLLDLAARAPGSRAWAVADLAQVEHLIAATEARLARTDVAAGRDAGEPAPPAEWRRPRPWDEEGRR